MGLRPLGIFLLLQREDRLYTSESDVFRRQIPTYKDGPRAVKVTHAQYMRKVDIYISFVVNSGCKSPFQTMHSSQRTLLYHCLEVSRIITQCCF